ncbi:hypothetical protein SDC9_108985 [bioreactor metagenome]|uniref:Uncharacterized protein n=1 Tax=bioreactor metagenome TaxID=1076179 RepID=A0A645B9G7_9ZZZZ
MECFNCTEGIRERVVGPNGVEHFFSQTGETLRILFIDIASPAVPDCGQSCPVCHIKHSPHLMLKLVGCPVASSCVAGPGQTVVRKAAGPHEVRPPVIIHRILLEDLCIVDNGSEQPFGKLIGEMHGRFVDEVAFHRMHHDIHCSAHRLIGGKGIGQLRVHDGELQPGCVVVRSAFEVSILVGDDRRVAHFAACRSQGEHTPYGIAAFNGALLAVEIPNLPSMVQAVADTLCRVDDRSATHCKNEVDAFFAAQFNTLMHLAQAGVWYDTAKFYIGDALIAKGVCDLIQQSGLLGTFRSIMNQNFLASLHFHQRTCLCLGILSEYHFCGGVIRKISDHAFLR